MSCGDEDEGCMVWMGCMLVGIGSWVWVVYSLMSWEWEVSVFNGQWPMVGKMGCVCVGVWSDCCEFEVCCIDLQSVEICVISVTAVSRKESCGVGVT